MKSIGIDLGTTNTCVYFLDEDGKPVLVRDHRGRGIFPSAVWCAGPGKENVVGHQAKARIGFQPAPVMAVKRKMGTDEKVMLGGKGMTASEVSAEILRYAKHLVEKTTGDTIGSVVLSVPAYFDAGAKRDTQLAALEAFFGNDEGAANGRLQLVLEPEAAAYGYAEQDPTEDVKMLIYDFGGGTFDVTVLEKTPELGLSVLKFGGDSHLGGNDIDDRVARWILYLLRGGKPDALDRILHSLHYDSDLRYTVLQQVMADDIAGLRDVLRPEDRDLLIPKPPVFDLHLDATNAEDLARIQRLKLLAEDCKKQLTVQSEVEVALQSAFTDHSGEVVDIDIVLTRNDFNLLIGDIVARTLDETQRVVEKCGIPLWAFNRVLLVGGTCRMPIIAEELGRMFRCPVLLADPDTIVARGAALRARALGRASRLGDENLVLEYPCQTSDLHVDIGGHLIEPGAGASVWLTRSDGAQMSAAVIRDRFLIVGVELERNTENRFRLFVLDRAEESIGEAEFCIVHSAGVANIEITPKITKPIYYLAKSGFRVLFAEGEPLPATKVDRCYRANKENVIRIPIYEGERFLGDLRINDIDENVDVGAEIELCITIAKDYRVDAVATVVSTGQRAAIEFRIDRATIPPLAELERTKESVLGEIMNSIAAISDTGATVRFRQAVRRLVNEFTKASNANEPDLHHLFSLIGELIRVQSEINAHTFLAPPEEEFKQMILICRNLAGKFGTRAGGSSDEVMRRVNALEVAGREAWAQQNQREWTDITQHTANFIESLQRANVAETAPDIRHIPAAVLMRDILGWLDELTRALMEKNLAALFEDAIQKHRCEIRAVDLRDEDSARQELLNFVRKTTLPLDNRIKAAVRAAGRGRGDAGATSDVDWR